MCALILVSPTPTDTDTGLGGALPCATLCYATGAAVDSLSLQDTIIYISSRSGAGRSSLPLDTTRCGSAGDLEAAVWCQGDSEESFRLIGMHYAAVATLSSLLLLVLVVLAPTRGLLLLLHSQPARRRSGGVVRSNAAPRLLPVRGSGRRSHDFLSDVENGDGGAVGADRPCVTLKIALDANGAVDELADQESKRFTCGASLDLVHRLRAASDAVAVGVGTVLGTIHPHGAAERGSAAERRGRQPLGSSRQPPAHPRHRHRARRDTTQLFCSGAMRSFAQRQGVDDDLGITTSSSSSSSKAGG